MIWKQLFVCCMAKGIWEGNKMDEPSCIRSITTGTWIQRLPRGRVPGTVEEKQSCNHFSLLRSTSLTPTKSCALCLTDSFLSKALGLLMGSYPRGGYWNSSDTKTFDRLVPRALQTLQSHWSMIWVVYLALCLHIRRIQVWEKQAQGWKSSQPTGGGRSEVGAEAR